EDIKHVSDSRTLANESDYLPKLVVVSESILAYSGTFTSQAGAQRRYFWAALCALDDSRHGREDAQTSKEILPGDLKMDGANGGNDGGVYTAERTKRCEFHSISRPLTIERVRSSVCTQDISTERGLSWRSCGMQRETCYHPLFALTQTHPSSGLENDSAEEQNATEVGNRSSPDSPHIMPADRGFSTPLKPGN
ncbi:Uncharacterized protein DBV15_08997, partial [Temnothorax longispinosus]